MNNHDMPPIPDYSAHPDFAIAALLHMLARYPMTDCPAIANSVLAHLRLVSDDVRYAGSIRAAASQSANEWAAMIALRTTLARH